MTPTKALELKKSINKAYPRRRLIYSSVKEELRVWVYAWSLDGDKNPYDEAKERTAIANLLNAVAEGGQRPRYRIERKRDMGLGKHTYICFK